MSHDIVRILHEQPEYPAMLGPFTDAPRQLYLRGNIALLERPCVAVVGTRAATQYGTEVTRRIVSELVRAGVVIVSGLALGIDAIAHQAALDAGGHTIAVLGGGIDDDTIAPRQNLSLAHDILTQDGLILSEYENGTVPSKWTFPERNRIVSGLSRAVVVTEAAARSGALITARLAADQGREVYAVPGSIFWPRSAGPHQLIRDGAHPLTSAGELIAELGLPASMDASERSLSTLTPEQRRIVVILNDGPTHLDDIIVRSGLTTPETSSLLVRMELDGIVERIDGNHYRIL
jgi:DNA processing protein